MMKNMIFWMLLISSTLSFSMEKGGTISGFVYDKSSGEALIGANVFYEATHYGSMTNHNGYFSIPKVPPGEYTLHCQYIGYRSYTRQVKITADQNERFQIYLEPTAIRTQEVYVVADSVRKSLQLYRRPISKIELRPREIESIPQVAEVDLLRSLQTMPGIASISDYSSEIYVRGGTPDQNLYLIDGADVYNPEHFFGLFSTFNTDAIKNVEMSKGGFGAEYGGRLSSILDITNLDGNRREYEGKVSVSLLSVKSTMQLPLGKLGAISGSLRRTYFDQTIGRALDDVPDYYFYDGHLKTFLDINENNKLTISTYVGRDNLDYDIIDNPSESEKLVYHWGNATASIRWTHLFSPVLFGNFWLTASRFDSDFKLEDFTEKNNIQDLTAKGNFEYFHSPRLNTKLGLEFKNFSGKLYEVFPGGKVDVHRRPQYVAAYVQTEWRPSPLIEFQSGLRFDYFRNQRRFHDLAPRFSFKYRLTETINLKSALGYYHQYLFRIPRTFVADIWTSSDEYYGSSNAQHYIIGFQKELAQDWELEIETYYKDYENLYSFSYFFYTDLKPNRYDDDGNPIYTDTRGIFDRGDGRSYGLELLMRKEAGPVTGWIAYTLGRTLMTVDGVNQGKAFVPRHDRTSTLNVIADIDLRNTVRQFSGRATGSDRTSWRVGFGFIYASGQPITTTSSVYVSNPLPDQNFYQGYNIYPTARNDFRLPPYIRLDLSLTMDKKYRSFRLIPFLQVFNVTDRKNVWFIRYDDELEGNKIIQKIDTFSMFPILPTIGVSLIF